MFKKNLIIFSTVIISLCIFSSKAFPYGYGKVGEEPLITMFKKVISEAKKPRKDWDSISSLIKEYEYNIRNLDKFFSSDIRYDFDVALNEKDMKKIINSSVCLIFMSMMEKYELIKQKKFNDNDFCKSRLGINKKYYKEIFERNVIAFDKKNGTSINEAILKNMADIRSTIGSPGKYGIAKIDPNPEEFEKNFCAIRDGLCEVFPFLKINYYQPEESTPNN